MSTEKTEINFQIIDSGRLGLFTRAEADYSLGKIHLVNLDAGRVASARLIEFSDPRYKDSDPWLSPSGNELFFISNRPAYLGDVREDEDDYDIWRSRRAGAYWTAPEHLSSVNSLAGEFGPEVHRGHLYFSSKKRGRYEIYSAPRLGDGFGKPQLLPEPINGPHANSDFTLTKDGQVALWWSTRPGGLGSGDLYVSRVTDQGWTDPVNLGPNVNSEYLDFTPSLSPNNAVFYFASNRPVAGQDPGASDIYSVAVNDLQPLRDALRASSMARLKRAFGGESVLDQVHSVSYRLDVDRGPKGQSAEEVFIDFETGSVAVRDPQSTLPRGQDSARPDRVSRSAAAPQYRLAKMGEGNLQGEASEPAVRQDLLATLSANFLFYLTAEDFALSGPENVTGHGDLNWYHLEARGETSPLVGLDPVTGRIVKVLSSSGAVVTELDYLEHDSGLVWPYRFLVRRDGELILSGHFSELRVNRPIPKSLPPWFGREQSVTSRNKKAAR
ncbi:MAG: hypothetical protein AAFU77_15905 [Myxococcota bacterium]